MSRQVNVFSPQNNGMTQIDVLGKLYTSGISKEYDLTPSETLALHGLVNHLNTYEGNTYPHQHLIADNYNISRETVTRAISKLKEHGLLVSYKRQYNSNSYRFTQKFYDFLTQNNDAGESNSPATQKINTSQIIAPENKKIKSSSFLNHNKSDEISHPYTEQKIKQDNKLSSCENNQKNDDEKFKLIKKIKKLGFQNPNKYFNKYSITQISDYLNFVMDDANNISNKGAYLRRLLDTGCTLTPKTDNIVNMDARRDEAIKQRSEETLRNIEEMKKSSTGRYSRKEIITKLVQQEKFEEAQNLAKLWKIKIDLKN